ncbi:MAG: bifunctional tetrahydrofolate synthase/dihydrofolate synthase [Methylococcaceae bacterium]|nr:bifunctional tetrahydrofolate synthase/dihydrofolate synthase [Methylococcaceae bacterium]
MARFDSLEAWLTWQERFHPRLIDLGLERAAQVFKRLHPDYSKPLTITVGGTNGKGSSIAFLEAIYRAQGYKVGTFTSPHILRYNERIKIDGVPVEDTLICEAFERIDNVREDVSLSYFEFGTLAAVDIFSRADLDIQLLEVGLGGRLDSVNIISADLAIITSICIDHVDWLGGTREAIGQEKAGIFRANKPAVIGDKNPPDSLIYAAQEKQTPLSCINKEFDYHKSTDTWEWTSSTQHYTDLPIPALKGQHQFNNASSVLMAVTKMQPYLAVDRKAIDSGLQTVKLTGRFQLIEGDIPVLLDVGHNPQAVKMLAEYLKNNFADKTIHAVFAIMKDKDVSSIIDIMRDVVEDWFISPINTPRATSETVLQSLFAQKNLNNTMFGFQNLSEAVAAAKKNAKKDELILIFGSFFLVSEYLTEFKNV